MGSEPLAAQPRPGAINVCTVCRGLSRHEIDGTLRILTPVEESTFRADPRAKALFAAMSAAFPPADSIEDDLRSLLGRGRR